MNKSDNLSKNKSGIIGKLFRFFRNVFAVIGLMYVVYSFCFDLSVITSDSMKPTLQGTWDTQQDYVLTEKVSYCFRDPHRWEIVKYPLKDEIGTIVMKRVVGLIGETVSIEEHWACINGKPVERPAHLDFLKYYGVGSLHNGKQVLCENGYFTFGDDNIDSYDSRFTGLVKKKDIEGRAWLIIWPPSRIGFVR